MRLHTRLEEVDALRTVGVGCHLLTTRVMDLRHLADEGHDIAQELHQALHTHVLVGIDAEHREDIAHHQALADTLAHLVLRERLLLEKLLHQCLVVLGGSLHERLVELHGFLHLLGGNLLALRCATVRTP